MQTKWVNDLNGQPFIEMIKIPSGNFTMGANESSYSSEKPERNVFLHEYYISKYPITNEQFYHFIQETNYTNTDDDFLQHWATNSDGSKSPPEYLLNHPVVYVNWTDCYTFCKTYGLTLPSEAQWEKAARGTDQRIYPWGNSEPDPAKPQCNFRNIFNGTTPVGTFDGSKETYNGIPIQKGTSPYGVEDMAGNVWEWCLDEWDSKWLQNMGDNPVDPCNRQKPTRRGLILEQVKALSIQYQEEVKQRLFSDTESYGAVHGVTSSPLTSTPPIVTVIPHYTGLASLASEGASKEEAEDQDPFSEVKGYVEVHGTTIISSSSVSPFAMTSTHPTGATLTDSEVAPKQEEEEKKEQLPFQKNECCEEVHGSLAISTASVPPTAPTITCYCMTTTSDSEVISEQEEERKPSPFQDSESCGEVRTTKSFPSLTASSVGLMTTHRSGNSVIASDVASEQEEPDEQSPFSQIGNCGEDHGIMNTVDAVVQPFGSPLNHQADTSEMALDVASEQEEEKDHLPFPDTKSYGAVTIPSVSTSPIASMATRRVEAAVEAYDVASEQQEETEVEQFPFPDTKEYVGVHTPSVIPMISELLTETLMPHQIDIESLALDAAPNQQETIGYSLFVRGVRGGAWYYPNINHHRTFYRLNNAPNYGYDDFGFRCCI